MRVECLFPISPKKPSSSVNRRFLSPAAFQFKLSFATSSPFCTSRCSNRNFSTWVRGLMGKPSFKAKKKQPVKPSGGGKQGNKAGIDEDTAVFICMAQELKDEGNKLFQKKDHEGAMLKFEKAVMLLPANHIDVASLRSNMAQCYMQLGIGEYPHAIRECNLALEVAPKYSKALLKRAKCYEGLNKVDLALRDVNVVLGMEPGNLMALEMGERLRKEAEMLGVKFDDKEIDLGVNKASPASKSTNKKSSGKAKNAVVAVESVVVDKGVVETAVVENGDAEIKENGNVENGEIKYENVEPDEGESEVVEVKVVVEEGNVGGAPAAVEDDELETRAVKLVFGDDIRWAQVLVNCSAGLVRDIVQDRFPSLKGILMKYRDSEGDLLTLTTTEELRLAESSAKGSLRLYIVEVSRHQEPVYERLEREVEVGKNGVKSRGVSKVGAMNLGPCIDDWIVHFAHLFKNHVGLDSDPYMDFPELGLKLYAEALEDTVTTEEAQGLFEISGEKFQEMTAFALFNWGNVHMSSARKWDPVSEDGSREAILEHIKAAYEWAQREYKKAAQRYEEAINMKPNFYEGYLALGRQKFEQAKLAWYFAIANEVALETGPSSEVIVLYNQAEDSMERGMLMWEELEERRLNGISKYDEDKVLLEKLGLDNSED